MPSRKPFKRHYTPERLLKARELRNHPSVAEKMVWEALRKGRTGFRFRRQHGLGPYVADFYCPEARVVLELDGEQHDPERDAARDRYIARLGIVTFRVHNLELFSKEHAVRDWLAELLDLCEARVSPPPAPSPPSA